MKKADLIIADEILSRQISLMRFTAGEKKKVFQIFLQMQDELKAKLQNGFTSFERARITKLLAECTKIINGFYDGVQSQFDFSGLAKAEAEASSKAMAVIGVDVSVPSASVLKAMVSDTLLQGAPLSAWWNKQAEDTAFKFSAQVRQGVAQGETLQQIITRIVGSQKHGTVGIMEVSRRNASTLVHDSIMQIANDAKLAVYRENSDVVKGVHWLATFDSHVCATCAALNGAEWDLEGNPINDTKFQFQAPPLHPNDRCVLTPITKTYRELGIDIPEMETGTRASDLGQIKADTSFSSFLKRHDAAYADNLLGKGKAELWRSGKITLTDLISQNGRELTLKQLQAGL
jgi:SPP1 gp7 family putative phage head morphogenesis protein